MQEESSLKPSGPLPKFLAADYGDSNRASPGGSPPGFGGAGAEASEGAAPSDITLLPYPPRSDKEGTSPSSAGGWGGGTPPLGDGGAAGGAGSRPASASQEAIIAAAAVPAAPQAIPRAAGSPSRGAFAAASANAFEAVGSTAGSMIARSHSSQPGGGTGGSTGSMGSTVSTGWGTRLMRIMSGRRSTETDFTVTQDGAGADWGGRGGGRGGSGSGGGEGGGTQLVGSFPRNSAPAPGGIRPALQRYSFGLIGGGRPPRPSEEAGKGPSTKSSGASAAPAGAGAGAEAGAAKVSPSKARRLLATISMPLQARTPAPAPRPPPHLIAVRGEGGA